MKGITDPVRLSGLFWLVLELTTGYAYGTSFRLVTYNLENYLDVPTQTRPAKSAESKAKIRESLLVLRPDLVALQEVGSVGALTELRQSLQTNGLDLPYWQFLSATDTNVHLALLSRLAFASTHVYTNESFLLNGRRFHVSRGFIEVDVRIEPNYTFTLIAAHLKSKRTVVEADEAEMRLEEAKLLREKIDARLAKDTSANLVVMGDFNDTKDSAPLKTIIGQGKTKLVDTRPAERSGINGLTFDSVLEPRRITWTHFYPKDDTYRRIDFVLLSRGMAREWIADKSCVLAMPEWGLGSDHRPVMAAFEAEDR